MQRSSSGGLEVSCSSVSSTAHSQVCRHDVLTGLTVRDKLEITEGQTPSWTRDTAQKGLKASLSFSLYFPRRQMNKQQSSGCCLLAGSEGEANRASVPEQSGTHCHIAAFIPLSKATNERDFSIISFLQPMIKAFQLASNHHTCLWCRETQ